MEQHANSEQLKTDSPEEQTVSPEKITMETLMDTDVNIRFELGKTRIPFERVLRMGTGSTLEMDRLIGEDLDIYIDEKRIAKGKVVIDGVTGYLGAEITELV